jgi:hypothetical protein
MIKRQFKVPATSTDILLPDIKLARRGRHPTRHIARQLKPQNKRVEKLSQVVLLLGP